VGIDPIMTTDVVTLIRDDHKLLTGLFDKLQAGEGDRRALVDEVTARLGAHAHAEEREVYPAIEKAAPDEADEVKHGYAEHREAEHLLGKVRNLVESEHFDQALDEFVQAVKHHVEEEECDILPALRAAADKKTLAQLGAAFTRVRLEELGKAGIEESAPDGLEHATRDELYEKAKEADIPGRSSMTKDELTEALREQH
jgi:hemerythrin superfamily protein